MSVSSTITTASAPSGMGAPVAISMHSPRADLCSGIWPVNTFSMRRKGPRGGAARADGVLGANGVAVHGRPREGRHVGGRDDVLGEHAAARFAASGTTLDAVIGAMARSMIARASSSAMVFLNGRIFVGNYKLPTTNFQLPNNLRLPER